MWGGKPNECGVFGRISSISFSRRYASFEDLLIDFCRVSLLAWNSSGVVVVGGAVSRV